MPIKKTIVATNLEDFDEVDVVEVLVNIGDFIKENQSIVTLESDKATMEFPSSLEGTVTSIEVSVGSKVKEGDPLITISSDETSAEEIEKQMQSEPIIETESNSKSTLGSAQKPVPNFQTDEAYASPSVRKYANELGVDLEQVSGSATHGRVLKDDVQYYIREKLTTDIQSAPTNNSYKLPDFSEYGPVEEVPLNKLKQVSARHLSHAWHVAPHVTQFDEADITDLEKARKIIKPDLEAEGIKLTILPFIIKALVKCLTKYPDFNSSINLKTNVLIRKNYYNIGIAVDTPRGLVVPVINDIDKKKIPEVATNLYEVSTLARESKLTPKNMRGGCMSVSSIGAIGGKHFTPIINYPEVAILGVSRADNKIVKANGKFEERLMLPLSLSYDHRAIDGVAAVRFITSLKNYLSDPWSLML